MTGGSVRNGRGRSAHGTRTWRLVRGLALAAALCLTLAAAPATAGAKVIFKQLFPVNASRYPAVAMARTPNGTLHLVFQTFAGGGFNGLATRSISPSGHPGPLTQALAGWMAGQPGLVAYPNGNLQAFFGGGSPSLVSAVWGMSSSNGGASWTTPVQVQAGGPNEAGAYASDVTAALSGGTPILTLPHIGLIVIQAGLGTGAPNFVLAADASANSEIVTDRATGQAVVGWVSNGHSPGLYFQAAWPKVGARNYISGDTSQAVAIAARDHGPGVFAAYTPDRRHVRLRRYGGGTVAVGSWHGVTPKRLGVATGIGGRVWVMWGDDDHGIALTRSSKAVTRFEPIQHVNPKSSVLNRVQGDGRLGPLDLLVNQLPRTTGPIPPTYEYYARVLPVLSARVKVQKLGNKKGQVIASKLVVTVTDAGDPVAGANVAAGGKPKKTNAAGKATIVIGGGGKKKATVVITDPGYQVLKLHVGF